MSLLILGSSEVVTAFALGGIRGVAAQTRSEAEAALEEIAAAGRVSILLIEEEIAELVREEVDRLKLDVRAPLLVEVPGFAGPAERRRTARDLVRQALGVRI